MRFYEYEAKALFRRHGLPLGASRVVESAEAAREAFEAILEIGVNFERRPEGAMPSISSAFD